MLTEYTIGDHVSVRMGLIGKSQRFYFDVDGKVFGMHLSMYEVAEIVKELNRYMKWGLYHPVRWEREKTFYTMDLFEIEGKTRIKLTSCDNSNVHNFNEVWFDITIDELNQWLLNIVRFKWEDVPQDGK